jgi:inner membrane protein
VAQATVRHHAERALAERGLDGAPMFITPTPFNTLLWRVVVQTGNGYLEGFDSLLLDEPDLGFKAYPSDWRALEDAGTVWAVQRLRWFSGDFVKTEVVNDTLLISDLRMGQEPFYVFTHLVAQRGNPHWKPLPTRLLPLQVERSEVFGSLRRIWTLAGNDRAD